MSDDGGKKKILIIDDDETWCALLSRALAKEGYQCTTSNRGKTGVLNAANQQVDLVLLDLTLPGDMDGFDTLKKLKEVPHTARTPVLVVSGRQDPASIEAAARLGAVGFLRKPVDFDGMMERIRKLVDSPPPLRTGITLP